MLEGTATHSRIFQLILALGVLITDGLMISNDIGTTLIILCIFFLLTLTALTAFMIYERVYKAPVLDAKDNIGEEPILKVILGKDLFVQYKKLMNKHGFRREFISDLVRNDLNKLISSYEIVQNYDMFSETMNKLDLEFGIRSKIKARLDLLEDSVFTRSYIDSLSEFPKKNLSYEKYKPEEIKTLIENGYQENGYNIHDTYYKFKVANEESTFYEELAYKLVTESLDESVKKALLA